MKKFSVFSILFALLLTFAFVQSACSRSGKDNAGDRAGAVLDQAEDSAKDAVDRAFAGNADGNTAIKAGSGIEGTWKPTVPIPGNRDATYTFSGNTFEFFFYENGEIGEGGKGAYTFTGTTGIITITHYYDTDTKTWMQMEGEEPKAPFSLITGNQLNMLGVPYTKQN